MPAFDAHKNFAYSTVATAPSPATSGTSLVIAAGDGAKFPAVPFNATVWPASSQPTVANAEIVRVTGISTDTMTIVRAQESTSARTVIVGDQIAETITAKTLTDVETAATATPGSFSFVLYDNYQRFTITDANVTTASKIIGTIRRPNIEEVDDTGWFYDFNVVKVANGSFDINVWASQWGENADGDLSGAAYRIENPAKVGDNTSAIQINGDGTNASERVAQPFTPTMSCVPASISVWVGTGGTPTDSLIVEIQTDAAGSPSGTAVGVGGTISPVNASAIAEAVVTLVDHPTLSAGTQYWIVARRTIQDLSNTWAWHAVTDGGPGKRRNSGSWFSLPVPGTLNYRLVFSPVLQTEALTLNYLLPA